jgi:SAM-dependent methyltransferase
MNAGQSDGTAEEIVCVEKPGTLDDVDEAGYLAANPDVRKSGIDAKAHFLATDPQDARLQAVNVEQVAEMRERKLAQLRFRRPRSTPRGYGEPVNFLTPALIAEFGIPEIPPVSANQYGGPFIDEIRNNPQRLCLDVGAGLRHSCFRNIVNAEIYPSVSTDVLCVGEDLPFESEQFDYVICAAVLEHTRRPWEVAREICRVLRPGGKLLVDYPFLQGVHGYPHHYFNATPQGAISLFEDRCEIISSTIEPNNHPIQSIWWILMAWRHGLAAEDRKTFENLTIGEMLATPPDQLLDAPYCKNLSEAMQRVIPAGSTLIARKRTDSAGTNRMESDVENETLFRNRINELEHEVAALRASRSWRLTAPIRALHRALSPHTSPPGRGRSA